MAKANSKGVFEKKNKKQIYPIYLISIPKTCRASISDTSDTSVSSFLRTRNARKKRKFFA